MQVTQKLVRAALSNRPIANCCTPRMRKLLLVAAIEDEDEDEDEGEVDNDDVEEKFETIIFLLCNGFLNPL